MSEDVMKHIDKYGCEVKALFCELRTLIYACADVMIDEKLWAKLPSYYCGSRFIRLIPFKDHINIEASAIPALAERFGSLSITPKGMLKLSIKDSIPRDALAEAFRQTLAN